MNNCCKKESNTFSAITKMHETDTNLKATWAVSMEGGVGMRVVRERWCRVVPD